MNVWLNQCYQVIQAIFVDFQTKNSNKIRADFLAKNGDFSLFEIENKIRPCDISSILVFKLCAKFQKNPQSRFRDFGRTHGRTNGCTGLILQVLSVFDQGPKNTIFSLTSQNKFETKIPTEIVSSLWEMIQLV